MTQRHFAQVVGISQGTLGSILAGKRPPPLKRIEAMARTLGIEGDERTQFLDAAYLAHAPEHVRRLVERLMDRSR